MDVPQDYSLELQLRVTFRCAFSEVVRNTGISVLLYHTHIC